MPLDADLPPQPSDPSILLLCYSIHVLVCVPCGERIDIAQPSRLLGTILSSHVMDDVHLRYTCYMSLSVSQVGSRLTLHSKVDCYGPIVFGPADAT